MSLATAIAWRGVRRERKVRETWTLLQEGERAEILRLFACACRATTTIAVCDDGTRIERDLAGLEDALASLSPGARALLDGAGTAPSPARDAGPTLRTLAHRTREVLGRLRDRMRLEIRRIPGADGFVPLAEAAVTT
ncbi:MAG: hypothetical protein HY608_11315 [Planctomycetes bacterium]|nr:hypothetical protein [Planctomycetota bacterium]